MGYTGLTGQSTSKAPRRSPAVRARRLAHVRGSFAHDQGRSRWRNTLIDL